MKIQIFKNQIHFAEPYDPYDDFFFAFSYFLIN